MSASVFPIHGGASSARGSLAAVALDHSMKYTDMIVGGTDPNKPGLPSWLKEYRRKNLHNIMRGLPAIQLAETHRLPTFFGTLYAKLITDQGVFDYGLISCRKVTDLGVAFIIDCLQNILEPETLRYHAIGTGAVAENQTDSALGAELTTVYTSDNTRAAGTQVEGATANIFRSVGSNAVDGSAAITEHALMTQQATGGGVCFDRTVFAAINVVSGNVLQTTYEWTLVAGG